MSVIIGINQKNSSIVGYDSRMSFGSSYSSINYTESMQKVFRIGKHTLLGVCGAVSALVAMRDSHIECGDLKLTREYITTVLMTDIKKILKDVSTKWYIIIVSGTKLFEIDTHFTCIEYDRFITNGYISSSRIIMNYVIKHKTLPDTLKVAKAIDMTISSGNGCGYPIIVKNVDERINDVIFDTKEELDSAVSVYIK